MSLNRVSEKFYYYYRDREWDNTDSTWLFENCNAFDKDEIIRSVKGRVLISPYLLSTALKIHNSYQFGAKSGTIIGFLDKSNKNTISRLRLFQSEKLGTKAPHRLKLAPKLITTEISDITCNSIKKDYKMFKKKFKDMK